MAELRRKLIPQFTIRWMLSATAVLAVAALIVSYALRAAPWAAGISIGLAALVIALAVYGVFFAIAWLVASLPAARRDRRQRRLPPAAGALLLVLAVASMETNARQLMAASGVTDVRPVFVPGLVNKTGLMLGIDTTWVDSAGYRPVSVSVRSIAGPVPADRVLTLSFSAGESRGEGGVTCVQTVEIPAGSSSVEATLAVPQFQPWGQFQLDTFENGEQLEQVSFRSGIPWTSGTSSIDSPVPKVLVLDAPGSVSPTEVFFPNQPSGQSIETALYTEYPPQSLSGPSVQAFGVRPISELPARWIEYTGVDIIMAPLSNLKILVEQSPEQWRAIRSWWRNGGILVVYDLGNRWEKLAEFERLVGLSHEDEPSEEAIDPQRHGWALPRESRHIVVKNIINGIEYALPDGSPIQSLAQGPGIGEEDEDDYLAINDRVPADRAPFVIQNVGLGLAVAIRADQRELNKNYPWLWLYNTMDQRRWQWSQRFGLSAEQANDEFWDFLIPGVGLAPVTQFQVLISLFVLLIGPLNYVFLRRRGKLNLMVLTVPAAALTITGALFAYAVLADGLGVRLRARSITHIDQRTGEATCWGRLSYYAGLAPADGLTFSDETAVFPMEPRLSDYRMTRGIDRTIEWQPADRSEQQSPLVQRLSEGWLRSRTPTQFITGRIRHTKARLEITTAGEGQSPHIVNKLGTRIEMLLVVDENGACHVGGTTDRDETVKLEPVESQAKAFEQYLYPILIQNVPSAPPGADFRSSPIYSSRYRRQSFNPNYRAQGQFGIVLPPTISNSLLERSIAQVTEALKNNRLPPGTYLAVVERSPEVELGTPAARQVSSFHIVVGEW